MLTLFLKIFAFLFAISILILIHEFCHFVVARRLGVKIIRFSIGLGKPFFIWRKNDIEYALSPIPLGGYVKMLNSHEAKLTNREKHLAFDKKSISTRAAILCAGSLGNLIFGFFAFWLMFVIGLQMTKPVVGSVLDNSPAALAGLTNGDEFLSIAKQNTKNWADVLLAIVPYLGEKDKLSITIKRGTSILDKPESLDITKWHTDIYQSNPLKDLGIIPYHPKVPPIINKVQENSVAAKIGLEPGDKILAIDNYKLTTWDDLLEFLEKNPEKPITLNVERQTKNLSFTTITDWKFGPGFKKIGYLGIKSIPAEWPFDMLRTIKYGPFMAIPNALAETNLFFKFNIYVLKKLITHKISLHVLGGPIMIWQSAAEALKQGTAIYLRFLAILSIAVAFTNLLPIPGLDGGYLFFLIIEGIMGKPISQKSQMLIFRLGIIILLLLFFQATINDLMRFV